jgi:hypothetical protein
MSESTNNRPDTNRAATVDQPPTDRSEVTVGEAAVLLGLSTDAVRSRLNRGTLDGRKDAGGWVVFLHRPSPTVEQPSTTGHRPAIDRDAIAAYEALAETQRAEIDFLRDQLAQRSRELAAERERFDVLHREALGRIPALGAGQDAATEHRAEQTSTEHQPRPWWRRWWER